MSMTPSLVLHSCLPKDPHLMGVLSFAPNTPLKPQKNQSQVVRVLRRSFLLEVDDAVKSPMCFTAVD